METIQGVSPVAERFKDYLTRSLPQDFVNYVLCEKSHRPGYRSSQPIVTEQFSFLVNESWDEGGREVVSYEDGSVALKIRETNPDININIVLTREQKLMLSGILPITDVVEILEHARNRKSYSSKNLINPDSVLTEIRVMKFIYPEKASQVNGIECSFEVSPEGKFLVKGLYLTD